MKYLNRITDYIGKTPLLKLHSLEGDCGMYAKCEFLNPYSIKDRPVLNTIVEAEKLRPERCKDIINYFITN